MATTHNAKLAQNRAAKKAYHSPNFVSYGNIRELTQNVGNMGSYDTGGSGSNQKTSLV